MHVILRLDPNRLRRWHLRLVERLARRSGLECRVEWAEATHGPYEGQSAVALLFALERLIHGLPDDDSTDRAEANEFAAFQSGREPADLVLDLCEAKSKKGKRNWTVTFDGHADEAVALAALTQGRTPVVQVVDAATGVEIVGGHPGTETSDILVLAFRDLLARTATLVMAALDGAGSRKSGDLTRASTMSTRAVVRFAARSLAGTLARTLYHLCYNTPHWRVGWRFVDAADVIDLRDHPAAGWRELPDDHRRFYADPFPVVKDGRTYLFVEEFEHRLGRGVISVVEFNETGPIGVPRPVLATDSHLSYPFVLEHGNQMWMVPESCANGTIDLYRGAPFPDQWVKEATLVTNVVASDATLFTHEGRWWMLASVRDDGGAYSDALYAWSASDLFGPWRPHRRNPLLVDIASARPAGRVVRRGRKLTRPFQDCTKGYGAALGLAEITRLDDEAFTQRIETVLRPGPRWSGRRFHTLNRAGRLECIDGSASARRWSLGRQ